MWHWRIYHGLMRHPVIAMPTDFDTIILGGGCAGLSLGVRLAQQSNARHRTLILEARDVYSNDKTWCFWRHHAHRWDTVAARTWSQMTVREGAREVPFDCHSTPYQMITADAFYSEAQRVISASTQVDLQLGRPINEAPIFENERWHLRTIDGVFSTRHVIDTRPARAPQAGGAILWQSFLGQELRCGSPVFDAKTVALMHFVESSTAAETNGVMFTYVLPFSTQHAVVETTIFGVKPLGVSDLRTHQSQAVQQWTRGSSHTITRTEHGILPMGLNASTDSSQPGYVRAGLMSGAARPSTGYAFQRIQRWADACAESLAAGRGPMVHAPDSAMRSAMDRLFLRVIRDDPARAPSLFLSLFARANAARVIRFLSDEGTLTDYVAIVAALPPGPFLQQLFRAERGLAR
jgi:lycopene beta-cyclase